MERISFNQLIQDTVNNQEEWKYYKNMPDIVIASNCFPQGILNSIIDSNESKYDIKFKYQTNCISLENQYPCIALSPSAFFPKSPNLSSSN